MTVEEEIIALKQRMLAAEHNVLRLARLVAILNGVPDEEIDKAIIEETEKMMKEKGEL